MAIRARLDHGISDASRPHRTAAEGPAYPLPWRARATVARLRARLDQSRLRVLLQAQSRIEWRIVALHWLVMALVASGALLPATLGPGLGLSSGLLVLGILILHPLGYLVLARYACVPLAHNGAARVAVLTALDVSTAVGVLFITVNKPGYTQVLLFTVVLLSATRYSLGRAFGITTLVSVLQFFSILAANHHSLQVTNLSSAVVAMFALTYGVSQLSQAERKMATIAADNAHLYRAVLLRNTELATIYGLSQTATQDTDPDRLLESGLELILSSMTLLGGHAFRYDAAAEALQLLFVRQAHLITGDHAWGCLAEARQAALSRGVVIIGIPFEGEEAVCRVSVPILVQGQPMAVLQAIIAAPDAQDGDLPPTQSLNVACQELGTWVEKALLRMAAQRSLVLEEKNRIARELHDTVLQMLFSAGLGTEWCLQRSRHDPELTHKLMDVRRLTARAGGELRGAIYTLSSTLSEVGLVPALEAMVGSFVEQYHLPVSFSTVGQLPDLALLRQNALHRVVRESLMNAYKHARASHVAARIIFGMDQVTVVVQDDGVGLPTGLAEHYTEDAGHFGLRTIARQIEELDGRFEVTNGEEGGTLVRATLPSRTPPGGGAG
ncbi:MAG TPA: histidine kinase [Chloroflexota bacterium]|nr:histidine kinase [Chloroflexota bacterium]